MSALGNVCFVDTETTGLQAAYHEIWEVGLITPESEYVWQLPVDLGKADPRALEIGRFHQRRPFAEDRITDRFSFATEFARLTRGHHLAGAVVSFDEERLRLLLKRSGACPEWHYHLIDVEALAAGYLACQRVGLGHDVLDPRPPWKSEDLSRAVGVDPEVFDRHTALGDARWARAIYLAVMGD